MIFKRMLFTVIASMLACGTATAALLGPLTSIRTTQTMASGHMLKADGSLLHWGTNPYVFPSSTELTPFSSPSGSWKAFRADTHAMGIMADGTLWGWGQDGGTCLITLGDPASCGGYVDIQQVGDSSWRWKGIATGYFYTLALRSDGTLWGWGANDYGQLAQSDTGSNINQPTQILDDQENPAGWRQIQTGNNFAIGMTNVGMLVGWGNNEWSVIDPFGGSVVTTPTPIEIYDQILTYAVGYNHALALTASGTIYSWGAPVDQNWDPTGALGTGDGYSDEIQTVSGNDWQSIGAGRDISAAIKNDGTLWAWGKWDGAPHYEPEQIGSDTDWARIAVGDEAFYGTKLDGSFWVRGKNDQGQLGTGNTDYVASFTQIDAANHIALTRSPARWDLGSVAYHSTHSQSFVISNDTASTFTISGIDLVRGGKYFKQTNDCPTGDLAPGASCTIDVTFAANGASGQASVRILSPSVYSGEVFIPITFTLTGPKLVLNWANWNYYRQVSVGSSTSLGVTIGNEGDGDLEITDIRVEGAEFALDYTNSIGLLSAGSGRGAAIVFTPAGYGVRKGKLHIDTTQLGTLTYTMKADGIGAPRLSFSAWTVDFGTVAPNSEQFETLTVSNTGDQALTFTYNPTGSVMLTVTGGDCGNILEPIALDAGTSCDIVVRFAPTQLGRRKGSIEFVSDDPLGTKYVKLKGLAE